jgi:hypothetical protein
MKSVQCFEDYFDKSHLRIYLFPIGKRLLPVLRKPRQKATRYCAFLQRKYLHYLDSIRQHTELFSRQKRFFII